MSLTTIDGALYISKDEFSYLYAVELINDLDGYQPQVVAEARAEQDIGYKRNGKQGANVWPELYLVKSIRKAVQSKAYSVTSTWGKCEIGEETLNGTIYGTPEEPVKYSSITGLPANAPMADLGFVGPASLIGKIALELCRRLELELSGDEWVRVRSFNPWEEADDPPAEE